MTDDCIEYDSSLEINALMTPEERLLKGIELTELMKSFNPKYDLELKRRMKGHFVLRHGTE